MNQLQPQKKHSTPYVMLWVIIALIPGIVAMTLMYGHGVITRLIFSGCAAMLIEAACLAARRAPIHTTLMDNSALLTSFLLVLALPPNMPFSMLLIGIFFAIAVAKQCFGGIGCNIFNPAMVAYCVLYISFPAEIVNWPDAMAIWQNNSYDTISSATPLDIYQQITRYHNTELLTQVGSTHPSTWIQPNQILLVIAWAIGGIILLWQRIIGWRIPLGVLTGLCGSAAIYQWLFPSHAAPILFHLLVGAGVYGAFFIATDPVTACTTPRGRLLYAVSIGCLTFIIRQSTPYPDGFAFATLLMNCCVPLLDNLTQPKPFGHQAS